MPIFLFISILTKQKTWMSVVGSCAIGMLLFMMIPALTPLNATIMNPINPLFGWRRSVQRRTRCIGYICVGKERPGLMEVSVSKSTKDCEKDVFNNS